MNLIELLEKANNAGYKEALAHEKGHDAPDFEEWYCSEQTQKELKNIVDLPVVSVTPDKLLSVARDIKLKLYKGEIKGDEQFEYLKDIDAIERVVKMLKPVS